MKFHHNSLFGQGPRRPLDREQRARYRFLLNAHRRAHRLTPNGELVGNALLKRLSMDGQCDPSHDTIAADVGCCARTVRRALDAMKAVGLVLWQRRIVREGWRTEQTSNAYCLALTENPADFSAPRCGGQNDRETRREDFIFVQMERECSQKEIQSAQDALTRRRAVVQAQLASRKGGR